MSILKTYRKFRIEVQSTSFEGELQTRFFGDDEDIITAYWPYRAGVGPQRILWSPNELLASSVPDEVVLGCCLKCRSSGCNDTHVKIEFDKHNVYWTWSQRGQEKTLAFDRANYVAEVDRACADRSWESPDATTARLLQMALDHETLARYGFKFAWNSGRERRDAFTIHLTLDPGAYDIDVHIPRNRRDPEAIAADAAAMLKEHPAAWRHVEWSADKAGSMSPPAFAGPGWAPASRTFYPRFHRFLFPLEEHRNFDH